MLFPIVLLSTCTSDQGLAPERRVETRMDLTGLLRAGSAFPILIDQVQVQLVKHSNPTVVVFDTTITGSGIGTQGSALQVTLRVPLDESPEDFDFVAIARAGGVEYYRASGTVTVSTNTTTTTPPITPTYTGPGASADGIDFTLDTVIQTRDSVLLTATALAGSNPVLGVPVAFVSADSNTVRIRRSAGQPVNQAWAVVLATSGGNTVVTATLPNVAGTNAQATVSYVPGADRIATLSGDGQTVAPSGVSAPLTVQVLDANGETFPAGIIVTFARTAGPAGSSIAPLTAVTDGQGQASTVLTAGTTTGTVTVTASASRGGTPLTGSPLSFTATIATSTGPATALNPNSNLNQTQRVNTAASAPPSVKVVDAGGAGVAGVTVTFTAAAGNGIITGATKVSDAQGIATVTSWTMPQTVGTYSLTASSAGLTPLTFTSVATPDVAASVAVVSGDNQTAAASAALTLPLIAVVKDQFGNAVPGATVAWATPDGGSLAPASGPSSATGAAQTVWTLGPTAPTQHATATVAALTPATFTATASFGPPPITLGFAGIPGVGIGLNATINITLGAPAPVGGRVVTLVSGNTNLFSVAPTTVSIAAGQTTGTTVVSGVAAGTANLTASATGYTAGTLSVTVQNRSISVPTTLNVPYGQTASLPIQLPAPAPTGGVTFTVISSAPGSVAVESSPVTITAGSQAANATLDGVLPGPATITVHNAAYIDGITAATTTAALDITAGQVVPNASFGSPITINFLSNGAATAAPAPGITVSFVSRDSTCAIATAPVTIATGLVSTTSTVTYGGSATLQCVTYILATAPNLTPDSVQVVVQPKPVVSLSPITVGSGLQINTGFGLGAGNHGLINVTLSSDNPAVLLSPDAGTPGAASIVIAVPDGATGIGYYVQGLEGRTTDTVTATLTGSAPGFTSGTTTATAVEGAIDLQGLPATTTTLTPSSNVYVRLGIAIAGYGQLAQLQNLRAGAPAAVVATFTTPSNGFGTLLKKNTAQGVSQTALILSQQDNTPGDTTSGGIAFRPLLSGATTVSGTIPGFVSTPFATRPITVSQPAITIQGATVGSGLQVNTGFQLGASAHGNINVTLTSSDPKVLLSPNSTTPGTSSIVIPAPDGSTGFSYYVQGLEGRTTDTVTATITATAPGFSDGTTQVTAVEGATDLQGIPSTTTTLTPSNIVYVRLGIAVAGYSQLQQLQNLRAGAPASVVATFTTPAGGVGNLLKGGGATPGLSQTALIATQLDNTPTDTASGGVLFHPLSAGTTTVFGSIPGFVATTGQSTRSITVTQPTSSISPLSVGSGLQVNTGWSLGASAHGAINVTITSSNPAVLLSPDATTAGTSSLTIPIQDGIQSGQYYLQGLEGRTTDTVSSIVVVSAPGFSPDTAIMLDVPAALDLQGLPATTTTLSPGNIVYARLGIADAGFNQLIQLQNIRFGAPGPKTATFTTPSNGVGELLKGGTSSNVTQTAIIPIGLDNTPTDTASGGVMFHSLLSGTTTVTATIPGVTTTGQGTRSIAATQPAITVNGVTVGSGLQVNTNFSLGAPNHGDINVVLTSSNPAMLLSKDATTPGTSSITIPMLDGQTGGGFYVQGLEGQTSTVTTTVTVTAPGFTNGTAAIPVVQPSLDLQGLPGTSTPISGINLVYARLGISSGGITPLNQLQNLRAGGPGTVTVTFTTPAGGVGTLFKRGAANGLTQTATIALGINNTPTDTTSGGIAFVPLANGTTTVTASIPGFLNPTSATRSITLSTPTISVNGQTVGSGLQVGSNFSLSAANHGPINVTITGSDPAILLSPDATTAGQTSITIPVADGVQSVGFYIQGVEGRTGGLTGTITVSAPGFVSGTASTSVVQAALDLQGVPTTMAVGAPDASIYARVGTNSGGTTQLNALQAVRAGIPGGTLTVTFTTSAVGVASLFTGAGAGAATQTIQIPIGQVQSTTSIGSGGIGLRRVAAGTSTISVAIPNFLIPTTASSVVTVQ